MCQWLVLWLDYDREGENIAFEIIDVCTSVNRHLTIKRAHFSALIDRDIHRAVQNLDNANRYFVDAVDAGQEIDLQIGASFTRFQTMFLRDAFVIDSATDDRNLVLSYGPCQFPTLSFIVERYWHGRYSHMSWRNFGPLIVHIDQMKELRHSVGCVAIFFYHACAVIIYEMCVEEPTTTVTKVRQQEKLKYPPYPLNTIELEKRALRYFRMSSEHTIYDGGNCWSIHPSMVMVQAAVVETDQPKWWERSVPNMIDIHSTQEYYECCRSRLVIVDF